MSEEKLRLGGMALPNGVLVHGTRSWACAVRNDAGDIEVASAYKTFTANRVTRPFLRGPARLAEAMAVIPQVKRALPAAKLPMQSPKMIGTMLAAAVATKQVTESQRLRPLARELLGGVLSLAPVQHRRNARAAAQIGAVAASTEIFGWMTRNPGNLLAQALSKPGHELQHRLSTAEPTPEQLDVAEAALAACLELEHGPDR